MEKEFVPYELALRLKALGFDEPCVIIYYNDGKNYVISETLMTNNELSTHDEITSPLYQQTFRWFREKYNLFGKVYIVNFGADEYSFDIYDLYEEKYKYENFIGAGASYTGTFETYEEAELACLIKLIEIVKNKL
jgi:hypothetical protein